MHIIPASIKRLLIIFILLLATQISFAQRADSVVMLPENATLPADAQPLGKLKIGDNAITVNCNYEDYVREAKEKAAVVGGNLVKITKTISPVFISKCYKIEVEVYKCAHPPYPEKRTAAQDTGHAHYALLYVYRFKDTLALEPHFDLHLNNDSVICRVKARTHSIIKISDTGTVTLWTKSGHPSPITLHPKAGEAYYLRCAMIHGDMHLEPFMELVDSKEGAYEFAKQGRSSSDAAEGLNYLKQVH